MIALALARVTGPLDAKPPHTIKDQAQFFTVGIDDLQQKRAHVHGQKATFWYHLTTSPSFNQSL